VGRQKPMKEVEGIDFGTLGHGLGKVGQPDQQQQNKRDRCQQRVEGQGTCEKGDVVFVSRLQRATDEAGG
jgi:hypothetical protein